MTRISLIAVATVLAAPAFALAIDAETDTNADGFLSFDEIQVAMPEITEELFIVMDVTEDGLIDTDELAAAEAAAILPVTDG
ncbi:MAG: hypothetical protein AAGI10_04990 [Pseudomonadota bacterium]